MADFRARQRVAIHDGTDEFGVASAKPLFVQLSDGTDVALINASGQVAVEVGNTVTVTATNLDIRDLTHVSDSVKIGDGTDLLAIAADGSIAVTDNGASLTVDATNLDIRDLSSATDSVSAVQSGTWDIGTLTSITNDVNIADGGNSITVDATDLDIRDLSSVTDSVAAVQSGTWDIGTVTTITNAVTVTATDLDVRDLTHASDSIQVGDGTDLLAVNADGSINVVVAGSAGTKVQNYDTSAAIAKDASDNHDYTVTSGKTLLLKQIIVAASGAMKVTIQAGPLASLVTYAVVFTSGAKPTEVITFEEPISVPDTSTGTVRVIRRNDDSQAMDVYSTIIGIES